MNTTTHDPISAVSRYREGVRDQLRDLAPAEVSDVLADVSSTLEELTAEAVRSSAPGSATETGRTADRAAETEDDRYAALVARLGTPQDYATELRTAAGWPATPPVPTVDADTEAADRAAQVAAGIAVGALVLACVLVALVGLTVLAGASPHTLISGWLLTVVVLLAAIPALFGPRSAPDLPEVAALPAVVAARQRLVGSRPGPGSAEGRAVGFVATLQPAWWVLRALLAVWLVGFADIGWVTVFLTVIAVATSIWLGARARADRRWLWLVAPLNVLAVFVLLAALWSTDRAGTTSPSAVSSTAPGLYQDGQEITDLIPVDATGRRLTGVYLFDQDGRLIDTGATTCAESRAWERGAAAPAPPPAPYPRGTADRTGPTCRQLPPAPLVVAIPTTGSTGAPTSGVTSAPPPGATSAPTAPPTADPTPTG